MEGPVSMHVSSSSVLKEEIWETSLDAWERTVWEWVAELRADSRVPP